MMHRATMLGLLLGLACGGEAPPAPRPPNIVLIVADDQGYTDYGFMGSEWVKTPQLDRLAATGTVFPNARVTASICRPTLMSLLTGLDPIQWDQELLTGRLASPGYSGAELIRRVDTLPRLLQQRGYVSFQGGKYWEGTFEAAGFTHGMTDRQDDALTPSGGPGLALGIETMQPVYDFIDAHTDEPFLIWFAPKLPHVPHKPPGEYRRLYANSGLNNAARLYYGMCSWFDALAGDLLAHLDAKGLRENTIVVFLADNGWDQPPEKEFRPWRHDILLGGPKGKDSPYELGLRTPLVVSWPGTLAAGRVSPELVSVLDLMPTLLDYAGLAKPEGRIGQSLRPLLEGGADPLHEELVSAMSGFRPKQEWPPSPAETAIGLLEEDVYSVRTRKWGYVYYVTRGVEELYDLAADPRQEHDVHAEYPREVAELRRRALDYRRRLLRPYLSRIEQRMAGGTATVSDGIEAYCIRRLWSADRCLEFVRDVRRAGSALAPSPSPAP